MNRVIGISLIILVFTGLFFTLSLSGEVVVQAIRIDSAPIIDGKLTDICWQKAMQVTNFLLMDSNRPAKYQTIGYVLYDDTNLYIGIKCLEPNISSIKTKIRKYDDIALFEDDVVEIMISPGLNQTDYFHFAINASGLKFDMFHRREGGIEYIDWNGDWKTASFVGDNYWACEVSIPYYTLAITSKTGSKWGINLCREKQVPLELSSIGKSGAFNKPGKFAHLNGIDIDFKKYYFTIGETEILGEIKDNKIYGRLVVPVKNESKTEKKVKIEILQTDKAGVVSIKSEEVTFKSNEEKNVLLELLEIKPASNREKSEYSVPEHGIKKMKILDLEGKVIFADSYIIVPDFYTPLEVIVTNPTVPELDVIANFSEEELKKRNLSVEITNEQKSEILFEKTIISPLPITKVTIPNEKIPNGRFIARGVIKNLKGETIAEDNTKFVKFTTEVKKLNNLVVELLNIEIETLAGSYKEYKFENPRDGWIFISTTANTERNCNVFISIDSLSEKEAVIVHQKSGETLEAMRLLSAGEHKIRIKSDAKTSVSLIVRSIPELIHEKFQPVPNKPGYTPYDWAFLQKYVLKNINCMVGYDDSYKPVIEEWKKQGKKWINTCGVHPIDNEAYTAWTGRYGLQEPLVDGIIVDEFYAGNKKEKFEAWIEAVKMIYNNEKFRDKTFYPYNFEIPNGGSFYIRRYSMRFAETVIESSKYNKIALEIYLQEEPTEDLVDKSLEFNLRREILNWKNAKPGYGPDKMIIVLGYFNIPGKESLNVNPKVDWKVFMDKEFNFIVNDPAFDGLYGIMEYLSEYADEETVRWTSLLYRHYCIEGKKEMLSEKYGFKYNLDHIQNPDFDDGTSGWEIKQADVGSIDTKNIVGFGKVEGRWFRTIDCGDNFLWMKRSEKCPNVISQKIKNLRPGKLYSLKMLIGDYRYLSEGKSELEKEKHAISINIDNVELIQEVFADSFEVFNRKNRFINYHQKIFRAKGIDAELSISDWISDKEAGGPIGQELMYNFIEVQPYLDND